MGNVLGPAVMNGLRQPNIYRALGKDQHLTSIPVFEADQWLGSWRVITNSMPPQQAKLSLFGAQSSGSRLSVVVGLFGC